MSQWRLCKFCRARLREELGEICHYCDRAMFCCDGLPPETAPDSRDHAPHGFCNFCTEKKVPRISCGHRSDAYIEWYNKRQNGWQMVNKPNEGADVVRIVRTQPQPAPAVSPGEEIRRRAREAVQEGTFMITPQEWRLAQPPNTETEPGRRIFDVYDLVNYGIAVERADVNLTNERIRAILHEEDE